MPHIVPQGPWTTELDLNLHATHDGEICVPFHLYVQLRDPHLPDRKFPRFLQLPLELQTAIFHHCDRAELFQLMRVSQWARREAEKLFWSYPNAWCQIDGAWLLAGGFSGHTYNATDFLAHVKQVEVEFGGLGPLAHNAWEDGIQKYAKRPPSHVRDQQIDTFWQTLQRRFPCATNIVLSGRSGQDAGAPPPADLTIVAEKCPARIRASVSCIQGVAGYPARVTRTLWRQTHPNGNQAAAWGIVTLHWTRESVLPPPKKFSGPVGALCRIEYYQSHFFYRHFARWLLLIQATEAHYLQEGQKPCICPIAGCGLSFELPGQWATHAVDAAHDSDFDPPSARLKALIQDHFDRVARTDQQYVDAMADLQQDWGKEGSKQRLDAEHAFLSQLQHDPLYTHEKPPEESSIWRRYTDKMNNYPTLYTMA